MLIYGASGYTGELVAREAVRRGLAPILAGRNAATVEPLARELGLSFRAFPLEDAATIASAVRDCDAVLHCAGPFVRTSRPMVDACLDTGAHYLDISAEIRVIEALVRRDAEARRRRITIMPAVGFDVVPSDCLAAHLSRRLPAAQKLAFGVTGFRFISRGSAKTLMEATDYGVVRRDGVLTNVELEKSSGQALLDLEARRAVHKTAQLPPLPREFPDSSLTIHLTFDFQR